MRRRSAQAAEALAVFGAEAEDLLGIDRKKDEPQESGDTQKGPTHLIPDS